MKKTKRFVVTSAIVASLAMGTVSTAATAQTSQAASIVDQITSIFNQNNATPTTNGVNVNELKSVNLPAGQEVNQENVEAAIGGTPTLYGLIPATVALGKDGKSVDFSPNVSGVLGSALKVFVKTVNIPLNLQSSITFANGSTTANIKKGTNIKLDDSTLYSISGQGATIVKIINSGNFNYAYAGTYTPTVQAVDASDATHSSEQTQMTINVLDATFQNLNQTVVKGSNFNDASQVTGTDSLGQMLDITSSGNVDTSKPGQYNVTYTATDPSLDMQGNPIQWTEKGTINVVDADSSLTVNFQDANSGDIIDTTTLTGASGQNKSISAPSGYELVNSSDSTVTLTKGSSAKTVQVVKEGSSVQTPFSGTVSTYANGGVVPLYSTDGTQTSRSLSPNSDWQSDQTKTINGDKYYRVSTNEWVKASQVYEYTPLNTTITTNSDSIKSLYSIKGNKSSRSISPNSAWFTDRSASINGTQMYRVSTDEWVNASDVH